MGLLKKLGRGIKRVAKKNAGGVGRLVKKVGPGLVLNAIAPVAAPLIVKAASAAKTLGKKSRGLETPKSLVPIVKMAQVRVKSSRSKMPGGAPMPRTPKRKRGSYAADPYDARIITGTIATPKVGMMKSGAVGAHKTLYKKTARARTAKKKRVIKAPPSAKQLAARAAFAARARKKKAA